MKQRPFNLIEITIAIGVVAIGVVAVVGAFPGAANKSRDAMAESYSAETATQTLAFFERNLRANWDGFLPSLPDTKPKPTLPNDRNDRRNRMPYTQGCIYDTAEPGAYRIIRFANVDNSVDGGDGQPTYTTGDILDFEAELLVWREQVRFDGSNVLPYTIAIRLNAEISWPAQIEDYARRQKAFYATELFKR